MQFEKWTVIIFVQCIYGCNFCKPGIEVSKCVYLASMTVTIVHTAAGLIHDILQRCIFEDHASRSTGPKRGKNGQYLLLSIKTYLHARKSKYK